VILRGALDGLAAVVPYGDSGLVNLRRETLLPPPGKPDGLLDFGGFIGLHPAPAGVRVFPDSEYIGANTRVDPHLIAPSGTQLCTISDA
jgi:hypothetical protein